MRDRLAARLNALWNRRGVTSWLLWPLGAVVGALALRRRALYVSGPLRSVKLPVPVIVVGNISVGGTGKTPVTIWLAQKLRERGFRVGIIGRGYGGNADSWPQAVTATSDPEVVGDEAVLLAHRTGCPVVVGPDRVAAAKRLIEANDVDLLISDDGLQHYRLARDLEIAVVDGVRAMGNGWCLPAGPLREPVSRLDDVDVVVVNGGEWGHAGVLRFAMRPLHVYELTSGRQTFLGDFKGQSVHAVAGVGNPERFFDLLEESGLYVDAQPLADHAAITEDDLTFEDTRPVLVTEKDAVKCVRYQIENVWCVVADIEFEQRDDERLMRIVIRQIEQALP